MSAMSVYLTERDAKRLQDILRSMGSLEGERNAHLRRLADKLSQAVVTESVPDDVISMNARFRLLDLDTGERQTFRLVFPQRTSGRAGALSILAPAGSTLLGSRLADVLEWEVPSGRKKFRIEEISYLSEEAERQGT